MAGRMSRGRDATIAVRAGNLRTRGGATAVATANAVLMESGVVRADAACSRGADAGGEAGRAGRAASVSAR